jgi:hypothetical protein
MRFGLCCRPFDRQFRPRIFGFHCKDFPTVAVRIGDPGFVLQSEAAIHVQLIRRDQSGLSEPLLCGQDLRSARYLYPQVWFKALGPSMRA